MIHLSMIEPSSFIPCPCIRRRFSAPGKLASARLTITGLGIYTAYLNGKRLGNEYLSPGFNDYDAYVRCAEMDVSWAMEEENLLEVILTDGWYRGRIGFGDPSDKRWGDSYMLGARLEMRDADGNVSLLETDSTWEAVRSFISFSDIYDGEVRDDTREAGDPVPCRPCALKGELTETFTPPVRVRAAIKPKLLRTPKGENVLDFGQNMAGIVRFHSRLKRGGTIRLQAGEVLQEECFYRDNLRSARAEYLYTSDGVEKDVEMLGTFYGFRYMLVTGPEKVDPDDFTALALSSDLKRTLEVETGHAGINQLMHNALWGQMSNFVDVPTDCPQRDERLGWTADTQVFVNTACYQMDCRDFYAKYMRDMREDQVRYGEGDLPCYSPSLKGAGSHGGAVWADAGTIIPWNIYQQYGDMELLKENYPMMRDYCDYLIRQDEKDGGSHVRFSAFTFGDWVAQDGLTPQSVFGGTEPALIQAVYYMNSLELTEKAAWLTGEKEDALRFGRLSREVRCAVMDEFVTRGGRLAVDTQCAYVLALRYGLYRDLEKMKQGFRSRLRKDFYAIRTGFTGTYQILQVLFDFGMDDVAFRMLLRETFPGWLYCVNLGATTIWERWNSLDEQGRITGTGMNSLNHYAYGSVCEAIYSRVMGLRNLESGWRKAEMAPHVDGRLGHVSITFDSPSGRWKAGWALLQDGQLRVTLEVPEGAEADVRLPDFPGNQPGRTGQGEHEWVYMPKKDYLHPFSEETLIMDLMNSEEACRVLDQFEPRVLWRARQENSEYPVYTLRETLNAINPPEETGKELLKALQKVSVYPR